MNKPYLVLVDNKLWARKVNRISALKLIKELREKGLNAVIAYSVLEGGI